MKIKIFLFLLIAISVSAFAFNLFSSQNGDEPWTQQQLLDPSTLAKTLGNTGISQPIVYSVGPQAVIKGSIDIGSTVVPENLSKLQQKLEKLPKNAEIVIYCGCCPFDRCPNVRPAVELLKKLQFSNFKLLNLPHNIKVDWIDHGYPLSE